MLGGLKTFLNKVAFGWLNNWGSLAGLNTEIKENLKDGVEGLVRSVEAQNSVIETIQKQVDTIARREERCNERLTSLEDGRITALETIFKLEGEARAARETIAKLETQARSARETIGRLEEASAEAKRHAEASAGRIAELETAVAAARQRVAEVESEASASRARIGELEAAISKARDSAEAAAGGAS